MRVAARACFFGGLKWENKTYKLKRSLDIAYSQRFIFFTIIVKLIK